MDKYINLDTYVEPEIIINASANESSDIKIFYSDEEIDKKIQKAHEDVLAGRVEPAEKVFAELSKKYNLWIILSFSQKKLDMI